MHMTRYSGALMLIVDVTYARWNGDADRHRNRGKDSRQISSGMAIVSISSFVKEEDGSKYRGGIASGQSTQ